MKPVRNRDATAAARGFFWPVACGIPLRDPRSRDLSTQMVRS